MCGAAELDWVLECGRILIAIHFTCFALLSLSFTLGWICPLNSPDHHIV